MVGLFDEVSSRDLSVIARAHWLIVATSHGALLARGFRKIGYFKLLQKRLCIFGRLRVHQIKAFAAGTIDANGRDFGLR